MIGWPRPILTDSGGFQVFSPAAALEDRRRRRASSARPSTARRATLTPEVSMEIQAALGSDIAMAFDHCPPGDAPREVVDDAMARTTRWAARCLAAPRPAGQQRFGIVQGGADARSAPAPPRARSARCRSTASRSAASPSASRSRSCTSCSTRSPTSCPPDRPRYLMGVGTPRDLVDGIAAGIDMFDCVMPTRNARNGQLFTWRGKLVISQRALPRRPRPARSRLRLRDLPHLLARLPAPPRSQCRRDPLRPRWPRCTTSLLPRAGPRARRAIFEGRYAAFAAEAISRFS